MTVKRILRCNDVDIACDIVGDGEPVLLIHGLGSHRGDWRLQIPALRERHRVVSYDVRGHGESGAPPDGFHYGMPQLAAEAAALIRGLDLGPTHVVGLSLGGMIGFQLAVDHPELVRSLTIVNSGPEVIPRTLKELLQIGLRLVLTRLVGPRGFARYLAPRLFPKPEQAQLRLDFIAHMATNDRDAYVRTTRAVIGWGIADRLGEIGCPVLVVSGDRDYTPVSRKAAYVRKLRRGSLVVIRDSGHVTPLDRPVEFNAELLRFLAAPERIPELTNVA
jgi:pimeloyl-ACP methyl ester carboxylesterase